MNRRTAITNLAALTLASCTGEAVYARGEVSPVPTEAEIWANPTAHGVMPLPYIRDELMRLTAQAVIWREWYRSRHEGGHAVYVGDVNGMATALRLMGVAESIDIAWAHQVVATLGQPLSDHSDTPWIMWPGNNAWRQPKTVGAVG
ncbi:MAG: hypothetical protein BGP24_14675 [Lysobacterales bacterium 69-70]|nr:MAG: hypothetical protein BGP24_14675 [Xanthomonadales bacterium 69-70]